MVFSIRPISRRVVAKLFCLEYEPNLPIPEGEKASYQNNYNLKLLSAMCK
jgi:hypothetical protein